MLGAEASVLRRLLATFAATRDRARGGSPPGSLTPRELEVLALVGRGLSNTDISERLYVSENTTKTHIGNLLAKLGAPNRAHLVIAAYESGLHPARGVIVRRGQGRTEALGGRLSTTTTPKPSAKGFEAAVFELATVAELAATLDAIPTDPARRRGRTRRCAR
ncbi:MAG TPA: helix-turn-helix transcriptional regulator [Acidimicrobiales bacterium]|nr:helix-turn-helix transcriptional regulator [Acidimicrobiales bacterium]